MKLISYLDGNLPGWYYHGFLTENYFISHNNTGCSDYVVSATIMGSLIGLGHELLHAMGVPHAPCGIQEVVALYNPAARYEDYDTGIATVVDGLVQYNDASIGEYGLDVDKGKIYSPDPASSFPGKDLMSYCANAWVSIWTHRFLSNKSQFDPVKVTGGEESTGSSGAAPGEAAATSQIVILGEVPSPEDVQVDYLFRVATHTPDMIVGQTQYRAELVDEEGEVIAASTLWSFIEQGGCSDCPETPMEYREHTVKPPFSFIALIPNVAEGAKIRIRSGDHTYFERGKPEISIRVEDVSARLTQNNQAHVTWRYAPAQGEKYEAWVRWSDDEGERWHPAAYGITGEEVNIDVSSIPSRRVRFQVMINDEYFTPSSESDDIDLPVIQPQLAIVAPQQDYKPRSGSPLHLHGTTVGGNSRGPARG